MTTTEVMDNFSDPASWSPIASGEAQLSITNTVAIGGGHALALAFDFKGGGGFVVARKEFHLLLPEAYAFSFRIRGIAPQNKLEFKLIDNSGKNVWRWEDAAFSPTEMGEKITLKNSQIAFAWGPAGGGALRELGAVEFAISAVEGGSGTLWIEGFCYHNRSPLRAPLVTASSSAAHTLPQYVLDEDPTLIWQCAPEDSQPSLRLDFHEPREYGGVILTWAQRAGPTAFHLQASDDAELWRDISRAKDARGQCSYIYAPQGESRYLQLLFSQAPIGVQRLEVQPYEFARSRIDFFHAIAARTPMGHYPRYLYREQSYWTCAGVLNGKTCALLNEDGLVEPDKGSFTLEPIVKIEGDYFTYAQATRSVSLANSALPIPSVLWDLGHATLEITVYAIVRKPSPLLFVRYRFVNNATTPRCVSLFVALRPFQVTPPWQSWNGLGGLSDITDIEAKQGAIWINHQKAVIPLEEPSAFSAMRFEEGGLIEALLAQNLPDARATCDPFGAASAVMRFDELIQPHESKTLYLVVPFGTCDDSDTHWVDSIRAEDGASAYHEAIETMTRRLMRVRFTLPPSIAAAARTFHTAAGHIEINKHDAALQPGPRRYTRSWIRDGAIMGAALLRTGDTRALQEFVQWYGAYQREDGYVPCCVDAAGADPLVEHDSHGQLIYAVAECYRLERDMHFLALMWPHVRLAANYLRGLISQESVLPDDSLPSKATHGLLPVSASHEGYLAHPVHSYWDNFWALRGLIDASAIARVMGELSDAEDFAAASDVLRKNLCASLSGVIQDKHLNYVPGSVEWADFDPTATANAIGLLQCLEVLPLEQVQSMFTTYMQDFRRKRRGQMAWENYTAYEVRIISALVRLGWRHEAQEVLEFLLSDRRPLEWNQWPEISWRVAQSPAHLGDLPHTWIAAEYILSFCSLWAYEVEKDDTLVIAAGIPLSWLTQQEGISVKRLPTWHGLIDITITRENATSISLVIGGALTVPRGGMVLRPPLPGPITRVTINGESSCEFSASEAHLRACPAHVVIECLVDASLG
ncbi:MAG: discoidin domain-containing protein [Roseimicrobium sp.]